MPKALDLTGKRKDHLLWLEKVSVDRSGNALWRVQCDCGKEMTQPASKFKRLTGCRSCSVKDKPKPSGTASHVFKGHGKIGSKYWSGVKRHARDRRLKFEISIEQGWDLFNKQGGRCAFTGEQLTFKISKGEIQTASLDRIDSTRGYTLDNVQWVHKTVNMMKRNLGNDEFLDWIKKIADNQ